MKKTIFSLCVLIIITGYCSCKKQSGSPNTNNGGNNSSNTSSTTGSGLSLFVSKTSSVKIGEPVLFSVVGLKKGDSIAYTVSPSNQSLIVQDSNKASITFSNSGTYSITAKDGDSSKSMQINVINAVFDSINYINNFPNPLQFSQGELLQVHITQFDSLHITQFDSLNEKNTAILLILETKTTKMYRCSMNSIVDTMNFSKDKNSINIYYSGIYNYNAPCDGGSSAATTFNYIHLNTTMPQTISINFNNATYIGTLSFANGKFNLNWPYTTGVIFN